MLGTLWGFVLCNNYPLAGGRGCSTSGGDGLGMGKLGVGTGLDSVVCCAFMEVPAGLGLTWMLSGPAGSVLSVRTCEFRWDGGRTQVPLSSEPLVVTFIKGAVVLNQENELFKENISIDL